MRIKLLQTSPACPEQYEAFDETNEQVGYLRLRHGRFRVDFPVNGGETIYEARPRGDGIFDNEEKDGYLQRAIDAIAKKLGRDGEEERSWYIVEDEEWAGPVDLH